MTDPTDAAAVEARLRELSRRLRRIELKKPASLRELATNEDLQDILARNLELAIQACTDIAAHVCGAHGVVPTTSGEALALLARKGMPESRLARRLRRAVGFRNVPVHEYTAVDWAIALRVLRRDLRDLATFGKAMLALVTGSARRPGPLRRRPRRRRSVRRRDCPREPGPAPARQPEIVTHRSR